MSKSIYMLTSYMPLQASDTDEVGEYAQSPHDGSITLTSEQVGAYDNIEMVEDTIKKLLSFQDIYNERYSYWTKYCAFVVKELPVNGTIDEHGNPPGFESVRSYLGDGAFNCFSDYDWNCKKQFAGRDDASEFVKPGDYALYLSRDKLIPILVDKLAPTKEEWAKQFAPGVFGDVTDDSGLAYMIDYGHDHPFSPYLFPMSVLPHFKLADRFKEKLQQEKIAYMNGEL